MEQQPPIISFRETINESFLPLLANTDRYLICYGGRGSSKSVFAAKKLIYRCLHEPYFRYILYRRTFNTIRDSQYQTIKDIIEEWGLQRAFTFSLAPLEIRCNSNGNKFICRGGDEPKKLKSIKDPTGVWYEEEIPGEDDFTTITTSIRTSKAAYLQEMFTINPEVEGDYKQHWFWKRFFKNQPEGTFSGTTTITLEDGKVFTNRYTCHHSTFMHNRWLPDSFRGQLMELQFENPYYYTIYALGLWGTKITEGTFYKLFDKLRNTRPESECQYNPLLPLHLTFDFNVHPYITMCIWQVETKEPATPGAGKTIKNCVQIDELCLPTPNNRTDMVCRHFAQKYINHTRGVFIYGDPAGLHEDTRTEKGYNDFRIILRELARFRPAAKWWRVAPSVVIRGQFINTIFAGYKEVEDPVVDMLNKSVEHITLTISERCVNTIADYMMLKEASDGRKDKTRVKHPQTGVSFEKYGHTSDANDYFICSFLANEFECYQRGGRKRQPILYTRSRYALR